MVNTLPKPSFAWHGIILEFEQLAKRTFNDFGAFVQTPDSPSNCDQWALSTTQP